jgi:hypothetical protein
MSLDVEAFAGELGGLFVEAGQSFYANSQEKWEQDKAFFEEIKVKYKEAAQVYLQAKIAGDDSLAEQMTTAMKQYTLAIRATVETARLQLESQAQEQLVSVLMGVGKAVGSILVGSLLGVL